MNPTISNFYDHDMILSDETIDNVGDEEKESETEKQAESKNKIITTNQIPIRRIKVIIKKPEQVVPQMKQNKCTAITGTTESVTELKKRSETDLIQQDKQLDGNKEGTGQSDNTTMRSRKRMSLMKKNVSTKRVEVAAPPREKKLVDDCSAQKRI
ncbi:hypothetical protein K7X08_010166 [Anisodus acutangulus]|uniref:Uncharacterized protein n=1 Tax=Anisodus acutangulus TaxID=402998 RepID=A0A9Q1N4N9_9SOLA|nr:hypothetical protein K7X08_010166 [Anisodus acutangulus]